MHMPSSTGGSHRIDTPPGLQPHGCSGYAPPTGSRERLAGLPGPTRTWTPSPGELGSRTTRAPAERTSSKMRSGLSPWERLPTEPANRIWLTRCNVSSYIFSTGQQHWHHGGTAGSRRDTPHHCRANGVACGGLKPPHLSTSAGVCESGAPCEKLRSVSAYARFQSVRDRLNVSLQDGDMLSGRLAA